MEIELMIYKQSGKYYTNEKMEIPEHMDFWNWENYIKFHLKGRYSGMFLTSIYPNEVPFLIKL